MSSRWKKKNSALKKKAEAEEKSKPFRVKSKVEIFLKE